MLKKHDHNFIAFFDEHTGFYLRTGIIENGRDTGQDPFMASFPELIDVGIMGHCTHGREGLCLRSGVECYQDGLHSNAPNMALEDFRTIVKECQGKTFQFALGGCGDPDQHEDFATMVQLCREHNIVPNFTTSGFRLSEECAEICKQYCGAVAVSWYRSPYTHTAIDLLLKHKVKTNIHYVLNKATISEALHRIKDNSFPKGINAVVFLLHKPIGLGSRDKIITTDNEEFQKFLTYVTSRQFPFKIGFDSCTVPALIKSTGIIDPNSLDTCEGARWSAYVTPDMKLLPCSFDNRAQRWAVDLRKHSIQEAWQSAEFEDFRQHFRSSCPTCHERERCLGGCPICPEIVLCDRRLSNDPKREITNLVG